MKDDTLYLKHIVMAIDRIQEYVGDLSRQDFESSRMAQDAVIRQFLVLGEAAKLVSEKFRSKYPDVAWKDAARMRDRLIHLYDRIDLDAVWLASHADLPVLKEQIQGILAKLGKG